MKKSYCESDFEKKTKFEPETAAESFFASIMMFAWIIAMYLLIP